MNIYKSWLVDQAALQYQQLFLWTPIFIGLGILLFFAWPSDPPFMLGGGAMVMALGLMRASKMSPILRILALAILLFITGFFAATLRTYFVSSPILSSEIKFANISGTIQSIEWMDQKSKQIRFVLRDIKIEQVNKLQTPQYIRLTLRSKENLINQYHIGDTISGLAGLNPPSPPTLPNGFDFQRHMFFKQIGALGFFYSAPDILFPAEKSSWQVAIENMRGRLSDRIKNYFNHDYAGIAIALTTGQRGAINQDDMNAMRGSGLAHMLAISGLHVGLVSGLVFFLIRLCLVLIPGAALHLPIKKIAAVIAFVAACFYMVMAGATIPTQRAVFMVGIVFLAVLTDRTAISMRLVALAASAILIVFPESILSASFQLSFAAVTALVFVYEHIRTKYKNIFIHKTLVAKLFYYIGGIILTSLIASIATMPFAFYHFQQVALLGVLANALSMPLLSFIVMPFMMMALFLIPFNLDSAAFWVAEYGIETILNIAHFTSELPGAALQTSVISSASFACMISASLIFILLKGHTRLISLPIIIAGIYLGVTTPKPDILISANHKLWAYVKTDEGLFVFSRMTERYARERWTQALGLQQKPNHKWNEDPDMICDDLACRLHLKGYKISFIKEKEAINQECKWADILISRRSVDKNKCQAKWIVDFKDAKYNGVHAIYLHDFVGSTNHKERQRPIIKSVTQMRANRIWTASNS